MAGKRKRYRLVDNYEDYGYIGEYNTLEELKKAASEWEEDTDMEKSDEALKIAFGDNYNEIEALDLSFKAYQELAVMVIAAMTGEEPEDFEKRKEEKKQSFRDKQVV